MAWENLSAEIAEEFAQLQAHDLDHPTRALARDSYSIRRAMPEEVIAHLRSLPRASRAARSPGSPTSRAASDKAYRAANREKRKAYNRRHYREHPEQRAAFNARRRVRRLSARLHARMMHRAKEIMGWGAE